MGTDEVKASEAALAAGREAAAEFEAENIELRRATLLRQGAMTALNTSLAIDRKTIEKQIADVEFTKALEANRGRRRVEAGDRARSQFGRASKSIAARDQAYAFLDHVATAVLKHDPLPLTESLAPSAIPWLAVVQPAVRADYERRAALPRTRSQISAFGEFPDVSEFDAAVASIRGELNGARDRAARRAAELDVALGA
jgi:hypothetical protein